MLPIINKITIFYTRIQRTILDEREERTKSMNAQSIHGHTVIDNVVYKVYIMLTVYTLLVHIYLIRNL